MRRWQVMPLGALAAAVLGVNAAVGHATLALWPQHADAALSLSVNADGAAVIEASRGGALGTFDMKVDIQPETLLDPLVDEIEIAWVPATEAQSSTFDRYLASSPRLEGTDAVGIHLKVNLVDDASWSTINSTHHERIEGNIREILQNTIPSIEILPNLSKGFLAKSMCSYYTWKTSDPLLEILHEHEDESLVLCFSSAFPLSSKNEGNSFFSNIVRDATDGSVDSGNSEIEHTLMEMKGGFSTGQQEHRLSVMKLGRGTAPATIEARYFEAWVEKSSNATETWRTTIPRGATKSDVLVITSITRGVDVDKLKHVWLQQDGKPTTPGSPISTLDIRAPKTSLAAKVHAAITGEGFHRQYVMDVEVLEPEVCGSISEGKTILVRVPVSSTAYIDLDEIRRMERFGEVKLLSFTKHIEIERPSPVSSQHLVGLEFIMSSGNQTRIEFPIHFRYQAPSENELYRQASVIAPEVFLYCPDRDRSPTTKSKLLGDDTAQNYFQSWGLLDSSDASVWLRLIMVSPLPVTEVLTPVGYLPSGGLVSSVTLLFASLGATVLVWVSSGVSKRAEIPTANVSAWKRQS